MTDVKAAPLIPDILTRDLDRTSDLIALAVRLRESGFVVTQLDTQISNLHVLLEKEKKEAAAIRAALEAAREADQAEFRRVQNEMNDTIRSLNENLSDASTYRNKVLDRANIYYSSWIKNPTTVAEITADQFWLSKLLSADGLENRMSAIENGLKEHLLQSESKGTIHAQITRLKTLSNESNEDAVKQILGKHTEGHVELIKALTYRAIETAVPIALLVQLHAGSSKSLIARTTHVINYAQNILGERVKRHVNTISYGDLLTFATRRTAYLLSKKPKVRNIVSVIQLLNQLAKRIDTNLPELEDLSEEAIQKLKRSTTTAFPVPTAQIRVSEIKVQDTTDPRLTHAIHLAKKYLPKDATVDFQRIKASVDKLTPKILFKDRKKKNIVQKAQPPPFPGVTRVHIYASDLGNSDNQFIYGTTPPSHWFWYQLPERKRIGSGVTGKVIANEAKRTSDEVVRRKTRTVAVQTAEKTTSTISPALAKSTEASLDLITNNKKMISDAFRGTKSSVIILYGPSGAGKTTTFFDLLTYLSLWSTQNDAKDMYYDYVINYGLRSLSADRDGTVPLNKPSGTSSFVRAVHESSILERTPLNKESSRGHMILRLSHPNHATTSLTIVDLAGIEDFSMEDDAIWQNFGTEERAARQDEGKLIKRDLRHFTEFWLRVSRGEGLTLTPTEQEIPLLVGLIQMVGKNPEMALVVKIAKFLDNKSQYGSFVTAAEFATIASVVAEQPSASYRRYEQFSKYMRHCSDWMMCRPVEDRQKEAVP